MSLENQTEQSRVRSDYFEMYSDTDYKTSNLFWILWEYLKKKKTSKILHLTTNMETATKIWVQVKFLLFAGCFWVSCCFCCLFNQNRQQTEGLPSSNARGALLKKFIFHFQQKFKRKIKMQLNPLLYMDKSAENQKYIHYYVHHKVRQFSRKPRNKNNVMWIKNKKYFLPSAKHSMPYLKQCDAQYR